MRNSNDGKALPPVNAGVSLHDEFFWLHPELFQMPILLNSSHEQSRNEHSDENYIDKSIALLRRAKSETIPEADKLSQSILANPCIIVDCNICPADIPLLLQHNSKLVVDVLKVLKDCDLLLPYLHEVINADLSDNKLALASLAVMNQLTADVDVPPQILHKYIYKLISTCSEIDDQYRKHRLIRLVCVFLQRMHLKKLMHNEEILVVVESFSLEYSNIQAAQVLYKMLRKF